MTGRGIDQILPAPGDPALCESYLTDARDYVRLAERVNGAVPVPVAPQWPWGEVLPLLHDLARHVPTVRLMNLETSITTCDAAVPGKAVHYRMSPANLACLLAAEVDVWALANNHVLDYGPAGLAETLASLARSGQRVVGAGSEVTEAWRPAPVPAGGHQVQVSAVAHPSSGTPRSWAASPSLPGVAFLPDLSMRTADQVATRLGDRRGEQSVVVLSVHWGSNWGYEVTDEQVRFAHRLVDAGVDVVHGHSSHHPRPVEVYGGRLIVYGCGDLVNDYEGITGVGTRYRDDLRLLYAADLAADGTLLALRMVPLRSRRLRLHAASAEEAGWLSGTMTAAGEPFGSRVNVSDGVLLLAYR